MDQEEREALQAEAKVKGLPEVYQEYPQLLKAHNARTKRTCTPDQLIEKLAELGGNLSAVAMAYDVSRSSVLLWLKNDGNLHMVNEVNETWDDIAEAQLNNKILSGNLDAIKFRLKTKAKKRGYFEQTDHNFTTTIKVKLEADGVQDVNGEEGDD